MFVKYDYYDKIKKINKKMFEIIKSVIKKIYF